MNCRRVRGSLLLLLFTMAASLAAHATDMTVTGMVLAPNGIIADGQISVSDQTISFVGPAVPPRRAARSWLSGGSSSPALSTSTTT